jgi:hypothetical protein
MAFLAIVGARAAAHGVLMTQHDAHHSQQPHPRDDQRDTTVRADAGERFYPAMLVARLARRDLSTIHRWCRIGYLVGAVRGNGPGRQPWLIPAAEGQRVAMACTVTLEPDVSPHAS